MAINKNHEFEELGGVKCAIVEKNAAQQRVDFLKDLLDFNGYTVVVNASPPPKTAAPPAATTVNPESAEGSIPPPPLPLQTPESFTIGVTDVTFNPTNAIFGRLLKTQDGRIVTLAYWQQKEAIANDEIPYFEKRV